MWIADSDLLPLQAQLEVGEIQPRLEPEARYPALSGAKIGNGKYDSLYNTLVTHRCKDSDPFSMPASNSWGIHRQ
jgi:hypothetical protein